MKRLLLIVAIVALLVLAKRWMDDEHPLGLVTADLVNPYPQASPLFPASQRFVEGINADPKLKSRFAAGLTTRGLYSGFGLALKRGARTLDAAALAVATTAMDRVLPHLDSHACAQAIRGRPGFDAALSAGMRDAFAQIAPSDHASLMAFYLQALKAEIGNAPARPVDQGELESALKALTSHLPPEDADRFLRSVLNKDAAADVELCKAGTILLHYAGPKDSILKIDRDREVLSRWGLGGK